MVNEQRRCYRFERRQAIDHLSAFAIDSGRSRHSLVSEQEIVRLECLSAYVREANGGLGMVRTATSCRKLVDSVSTVSAFLLTLTLACCTQGYIFVGMRLSSAQVKNILRALIPVFSYVWSRRQ